MVWRLWKDAGARRALRVRFGRNVSRAIAAVRRGGPGRIPGAVTGLEVGPVQVVIRGWLRSADESAVVVVRAGGQVIGTARPDVTLAVPDRAALRLTAHSVGWELGVPHDLVPMGTVTIGAVALGPSGLADNLGEYVGEHPETSGLGSVDLPAPFEVVSTAFDVCGWVRTDLEIDAVEVQVDDMQVVRARLFSAARPDVANVRARDAWSGLSGWSATVVLPPDQGTVWYADSRSTERSSVLRTWVLARGRRSLIDTRTVNLIPPPVELSAAEEDRAIALSRELDELLVLHRASQPHRARLNVLFVTHHLGLGGGQLYATELMRQMLAAGPLDVSVVVETDGVLRADLEELGISVRVVGSAPSTAVRYEEWLGQVAAYATLVRPDVVIANTAGCFWGVDLAERLARPSIWAVHESFEPELFLRHYFGGASDAWTRRRFYEAFAGASALVFEAMSTLRIFRHLAPPSRLLLVDYGVDVSAIEHFRGSVSREDVRRRLGLTRDEVALVCVGTYEARKAQAALSRAFLRVAHLYPSARLVLVGDAPGPYSDALHAVLEVEPGAAQIRTIGVTSAINEWYYAADAFVLASDVESLSRAMLEAMAFGAIPVVSDVFGTASVVQDGVTGILFDPTSMVDVQRALTRFLELSPDERWEMSERARELVTRTRDSRYYGVEYRMIVDALVDDPNLADFRAVQDEARSLRTRAAEHESRSDALA